ncbi:MAG: DUF1287 domain-containing protein [Sulfuricurvum sp.]|uniref:DUF1287 domain-containing protein n=1 Tax=Sulfuricurvum sp. TaxID=2025608 RepID=UPI002602D3B9|nr:DUF1287 domain-containing protein [Sulfuricurvum sp.]MDD5118934.1 DUF1287 domain-containing protein [Sulfuricurvum sp.]
MRILVILIFIISVTFGDIQIHPSLSKGFYLKLSDSAMELTKDKVVYDPTYYVLAYPKGDVPKSKGVCTDVVIRAYRKMGIDLQKEVHEDMAAHFNLYPKNWGRKTTDKNIDHRRVPNLMKFFSRKGESLPITQNPSDYRAGDIVCWNLYGGINHIGIVVEAKNGQGVNMIVHNIGEGQKLEDRLFSYKIIGHYRYK